MRPIIPTNVQMSPLVLSLGHSPDNAGVAGRSVRRIAAHTHPLPIVTDEVCKGHGAPARVSELASESQTVPVAWGSSWDTILAYVPLESENRHRLVDLAWRSDIRLPSWILPCGHTDSNCCLACAGG